MVDKITSPITSIELINKTNEIIDNLGSGGSGGLSYSSTCPAITPVSGVATWNVTHNLGTENIVVSLYNSSGALQECNATVTSSNAITVNFKASSNVTAGSYKIVVLASGGNTQTLSNYIASGTIITVGTSGADYTTLADAFSYLSGKWSDGSVTISIITNLTVTDDLELITSDFNIPLLIINGNSNTITLNFTTANTYTCGFRIYNQNPVQVSGVKFVGGTNGTTHILAGGYYTSSLLFSGCSFDNAYGGAFAYNVADVKVEGCTLLSLSVGMQAQQGGTLVSRGCTFGASGKKCVTCYSVYVGGVVRDGESTYTNYTNKGTQNANTFTSNGLIMLA